VAWRVWLEAEMREAKPVIMIEEYPYLCPTLILGCPY
jgi:hypothetical protein